MFERRAVDFYPTAQMKTYFKSSVLFLSYMKPLAGPNE